MKRWVIPVIFLFINVIFLPQAGADALIDNGNGTVTDNRTGLIWQQGEPGYMLWSEALSYCEGLSLGWYSDWRLPNIRELESIMDDSRYYPTIDTSFFPDAHAANYWSSTTYDDNPDSAWRVHFYYGGVGGNYKYNSGYVRCMRGGQGGSSGSLNINFSGTGGGTVSGTGTNGGIQFNFSTNSAYSKQFDIDTLVRLSAMSGEYSVFTGWSGACSGIADCNIMVSATMDVNAGFDFDTAHKSRIGNTSNYSETLQNAYDNAPTPGIINTWGTVFTENLTCGQSKKVTLKGGFNGGYTANNGQTILKGIFIIRNGSVVMEKLGIR